MRQRFFIILVFLILFLVFSCSQSSSPIDSESQAFVFDENFRAEKIPISFTYQGSELKGYFTRGKGRGPYPTVILLHGFPGNNKDVLGLAEVIPQNGWNAMVFNYRGTWDSEGLNTPLNSIEDVREAVSFLKNEDTIKKFNIDTQHIYLAGFSFGGCMAVIVAADDPSIRGVIFIAGANMHYLLKKMEEKSESGRMLVSMVKQTYSSPNVRADFDSMLKETLAAKDKFNIIQYAPRLADRNILIIGGWRDNQATLENHILPFYRALMKAGTKNLTPFLLVDNHSFKQERISLQSIVTTWLYIQVPQKPRPKKWGR
jgi:hypothetical protein